MIGLGEVFKLSSGCLFKSLKFSLVDLFYIFIIDIFIKNFCEICFLFCEFSINGCLYVIWVFLSCIVFLTYFRALSIVDNKVIKFYFYFVEFFFKFGNLL